MVTFEKTTPVPYTRSLLWKVGRFLLHLLEMLLAMGAGMGLFHLLERVVPTSSVLGEILKRGTDLHTILMIIFMTVPMVVWMMIRGHGVRHSIEMAVAMLAPMAAVIVLCRLGFDAYLPWLAEASCPAMFLGMLAAMLYRRHHYTGYTSHTAGEPACHTS